MSDSPDNIPFEGKVYFQIDLSLLRAGVAITFPLFVYMQRNASMVLRYNVNQAPSQTEIDKYLGKGLKFFACPMEFQPAWLKYLEAPTTVPEVAPPPSLESIPLPRDLTQSDFVTPPEELAEEKPLAPLARTLARALPAMSPEEKKEKLVNVGQVMLKSLTSIAQEEPAKKWEALRDCQLVTETLVEIGLQSFKNRTIYDDLVALSGPDIEHSTAVATIATIFALISGFSDEAELADISMSGLLHDVGLSLIPPAIALKPIERLTEAEFKVVHEHPLEGAQIIEEFGVELSDLVKLAVLQHHERFDGMGYPKKLRGVQIDERVQIIHLADLMADLMRGLITGQQMNPTDAFEKIKRDQDERHEQHASSEIFVPISQTALSPEQSSQLTLKKTGS